MIRKVEHVFFENIFSCRREGPLFHDFSLHLPILGISEVQLPTPRQLAPPVHFELPVLLGT